MSPVTPSRHSRWRTWGRRCVEPLLVMLLLGLFASLVMRLAPYYYTEPDCDAYIWLAKRFATFQSPVVYDTDPLQYDWHMWVETVDGGIVPKYNPGYPLFLAVAWRIGGDDAMPLVSPLLGILALLGAYLLCRQWMSRTAALFALATMAINPMLIFYSGYFLTHSADLCCAVWGMLGLWWWWRSDHPLAAMLGGLALGMAVAVRYSSLLLAIPLAILFVARASETWTCRNGDAATNRRRLVGLATLAVSYSVMGLALAIYHDRVFGSALLTGYALSDEQNAFSWHALAINYRMFAIGLATDGVGLLLPLGLLGLLLRATWPERLARFMWFVPGYLLYSAYYWSYPGIATYRFLLYTFPALIGGAYLLLDTLALRRPRRRWMYMAALFGLMLALSFGAPLAPWGPRQANPERNLLVATVRATAPVLPPDTVIYTYEPLVHYLNTRASYRVYTLNAYQPGWAPFGRQNDPRTPRSQAVRRARLDLFQHRETYDTLQRRLVTAVGAALDAGRPVALIVPTSRERNLRRQFGVGFDWQTAVDIEATHSQGPWRVYRLTRLVEPGTR